MGSVAHAGRDGELAERSLVDTAGISPAESAYRDLIFRGDLLLSVLRRETQTGPDALLRASEKEIEEWRERRQTVDQVAADYVAAIEKWCGEIEETFRPLASPRAA